MIMNAHRSDSWQNELEEIVKFGVGHLSSSDKYASLLPLCRAGQHISRPGAVQRALESLPEPRVQRRQLHKNQSVSAGKGLPALRDIQFLEARTVAIDPQPNVFYLSQLLGHGALLRLRDGRYQSVAQLQVHPAKQHFQILQVHQRN